MSMLVKPPYAVAAAVSGRISSKEELDIANAVDQLVRFLVMQKFMTGVPLEERAEMLTRHTDAANEYYDHFSEKDFALMTLVDDVFSSMDNEEVKKDD